MAEKEGYFHKFSPLFICVASPLPSRNLVLLHAGNDSGKRERNMAAMNIPGFQEQLWGNEPSPGAFYNFPGNQNGPKTAEQISPAKRTL